MEYAKHAHEEAKQHVVVVDQLLEVPLDYGKRLHADLLESRLKVDLVKSDQLIRLIQLQQLHCGVESLQLIYVFEGDKHILQTSEEMV